MTFDFTGLFEIVMSVLSVIASCFLIPWLKERLSAERLERLVKLVRIAVEAAEQLYGGGTGQQKKEYVVSFLLSKGIVFDVDEVTAIVESAVYQLPEWLETQLDLDTDNEEETLESEVE